METLSKIFGSEAKVKILRLFLFNPEIAFDIDSISDRVKENQQKVRKEINNLEKISFIRKKVFTKGFIKKGKKRLKKTGFNFQLNQNFPYIKPLHNLLISSKPLEPKEIAKKFISLGNIKLIIISGIFIQDQESRVDLLVVGDNIKKSVFESTIKNVEAELGKELKYAYFSTEDFKYRFRMFDKLVRDILDYPHEKVLNRLGDL